MKTPALLLILAFALTGCGCALKDMKRTYSFGYGEAHASVSFEPREGKTVRPLRTADNPFPGPGENPEPWHPKQTWSKTHGYNHGAGPLPQPTP